MADSILRRYTDIPALIHMLSNKKLTLLNPSTWDDKNDSYYLELYKKKKNLSSVLALCFSDTFETYHHWKVFAGTSSGVCIRFDKNLLLNSISNNKNIRHGLVKYRLLKELRADKPVICDLPFIKRHPFIHECEYRIIYEENLKHINTKEIDIDMSVIKRIILSPWMPKPIVKTLRQAIRNIDGCSNIEVFGTSLKDNLEWKNIGESAT